MAEMTGGRVLELREGRAVAGPLLERVCEFLWAVVEGYWLTCLYMEKYWKGDREGLISQIQQKGLELSMERRLEHFECLDMNIIGRAVRRQAEGRATEAEVRPFLRRSYEDWADARL